MSKRLTTFAFVGDMSIFGVRALGRAFIPPLELAYLTEQVFNGRTLFKVQRLTFHLCALYPLSLPPALRLALS